MVGGRSKKLARQIGGPILLGLLIYAVWDYSFTVAIGPDGLPTFTLANGIAIAALLRSKRTLWPALIAAAVAGQAAAIVLVQEMGFASAGVRSVASAIEFVPCAYLLRRRLGRYFDLTDFNHLISFGVIASLSMAVRLLFIHAMLPIAFPDLELSSGRAFEWIVSEYLGQFVLSLPLLAVTARLTPGFARFDKTAVGLLLASAVTLYLVFGPPIFPGLYIIMFPVMMAAWRYGLPGAGLGALLTIAASCLCTYAGIGPFIRLGAMGYSDAELGIYYNLFFSLELLVCLPLAVGRARQMVTGAALREALAASQQRAAQLESSEAQAQRLATEAVEVQGALTERMKELNCVYRVLEVTFDRRIEEEQIFRQIVEILPPSMHHPANAVTLIRKGDQLFRSRNWRDPVARLARPIRSEGREIGAIEVGYFGIEYSGPEAGMFLAEEEAMLSAVASRIGKMIDERMMSRRLNETERLSAIGELTGGIAHDFNNLLTVIVGSSATLAKDLDDPAQQKLAQLTLQAARQGSDLTRQLLAFSRQQLLDPRPIDIDALIEENRPLIERALGENIAFTVDEALDLPAAFADPAHLGSAILNLCINARDAMPGGGSLTIATGLARLPGQLLRREPEAVQGDHIVVRVRDTGTGIGPEIVDKIFEPFFTTKPTGKGSGLGLSMVYGFIQQSGGYLDLETELGTGTTFSLYLPLAGDDAVLSAGAGERNIEGGDEHILVVEDNDLVRASVRTQLERLGYRIVEASDAQQALSILADVDDIDLLFTDIIMPGDMNGRELGEAAVARQASLRVLYTSGYSRDVLLKDGRLKEGVTLLAKPYSDEDLAEKVRKVLDEIPLI